MTELRMRAVTPGGLSPPFPHAVLKLTLNEQTCTPTYSKRPPLNSPQELLTRLDERRPALCEELHRLEVLGTTCETKRVLPVAQSSHAPPLPSALPGEGSRHTATDGKSNGTKET